MPLLLQRHKTQNAKEVNFLNVLRGAGSVLPNLGTVLKGVIALATTKSDKYNSIGLLFEKTPPPIRARGHSPLDQQVTYGELNTKPTASLISWRSLASKR